MLVAMESGFGPGSSTGSAEARAALDTVDHAHGQVATRIRAPWWYHLGMGLSVGIMFASIGVETIGVALGGILLPIALMWLATRATGVRIDRYRMPAGVGWVVNLLYMALFFLAAGGGLAADVGAGADWAMPVAGAVMVLPTILVSYRIEQAYQRDVRATR